MNVIAAMCENGCTIGDGIAIFGLAIAVASVLGGFDFFHRG